MADTYTLDAKVIPGVQWTDDGDNVVEDAPVKITNIETPTAADGAANKSYVDAQVGATNELVEDLTPQLGANLDVNTFAIVSVANGDIAVTPNGAGNVTVTRGTGQIIFANLPTADPTVSGALWSNSGVLTVSA